MYSAAATACTYSIREGMAEIKERSFGRGRQFREGVRKISEGTVKSTNETGAIELRVEAGDGGYDLWLDDKRLHHIESYRIEKTENTPSGPYAELSIKMLVCYPAAK